MARQLESVLSLRVCKNDHERIQQRAKDAGLNAHEWCRVVILRGLDYDPDLFILLQEILATRRETRSLIRELIAGGELTAERFNFLMRETDEKKESLARKAIQQAREAANRLPREERE
jgi:hypothetical protein